MPEASPRSQVPDGGDLSDPLCAAHELICSSSPP